MMGENGGRHAGIITAKSGIDNRLRRHGSRRGKQRSHLGGDARCGSGERGCGRDGRGFESFADAGGDAVFFGGFVFEDFVGFSLDFGVVAGVGGDLFEAGTDDGVFAGVPEEDD